MSFLFPGNSIAEEELKDGLSAGSFMEGGQIKISDAIGGLNFCFDVIKKVI
jgi:hypothetical protein